MSVFKGISFKRSNVREFLFFLLLTTIFAVLSKLSKEYTKVYTVPVTVINVPLDNVVSTIEPQTIEVTTALNGFALLSNQFSDFELAIDFSQLEKTSIQTYRYIPEGHPSEIANALSRVSKVTATRPQQVIISIDKLASKEVPVIPNVNVSYKTGYGPKEIPKLSPSLVKVVGPKAYIDTITSIKTQVQEFTEISGDVEKQLTIETSTLPDQVKLSSYTFGYSQEVTKFTEGSFSIPVKIIHNNTNAVKIFPKTVDVFFTVPLEDYESVKASDFEVVCDFNKHNSQDDFIVVELKKTPAIVKSARLGIKQIKYIVVN